MESKEVKHVLNSKLLLNRSVKLEDLRLSELTAHHQRHFLNRFFFQTLATFPSLPPTFFSFLPFFF